MEQITTESWPVEVVFAGPRRQTVKSLQVLPGTTLRTAIEQSGILQEIPELDWSAAGIGVYGRLRDLDAPVQARERIEIYRPLQMDPKAARRTRARRASTASKKDETR